MYIPVLLGTARHGRKSEVIAKYISDRLISKGFEAPLLDIRQFVKTARTGGMKAAQRQVYAKALKRSDLFLIVAPEYNHSFPGELKLMIDELYEEYKGKRFGIVSVSSGGLGGTRGAELLRLQMAILGADVSLAPIHISHVESVIGGKSGLRDKASKQRLDAFIQSIN